MCKPLLALRSAPAAAQGGWPTSPAAACSATCRACCPTALRARLDAGRLDAAAGVRLAARSRRRRRRTRCCAPSTAASAWCVVVAPKRRSDGRRGARAAGESVHGSARSSARRRRSRLRGRPRRERMATLKVGVLISGRGTTWPALIEAARSADYPAEIALVVSNEADARRPGGRRRERGADSGGVATAARPDRADIRRGGVGRTRAAGVELVVLAGFMRLLSALVSARWRRPDDQHPPLAAARFPGLHTQRRRSMPACG